MGANKIIRRLKKEFYPLFYVLQNFQSDLLNQKFLLLIDSESTKNIM